MTPPAQSADQLPMMMEKLVSSRTFPLKKILTDGPSRRNLTQGNRDR
jgi:hypothetical protein